ncbi:hypothetical protein AURANDRAFT_69545, partial [Aureococcus anophagefferens]
LSNLRRRHPHLSVLNVLGCYLGNALPTARSRANCVIVNDRCWSRSVTAKPIELAKRLSDELALPPWSRQLGKTPSLGDNLFFSRGREHAREERPQWGSPPVGHGKIKVEVEVEVK